MAPLSIETTLKLRSGYEIPQLGFGVWQIPSNQAQAAVTHALNVGYRHIDSAAAYRNEAPCGLAVRASPLPRAALFFTSKVPSNSYAAAKAQVAASLAASGLDYLDLMLLHAPYGGSAARKGAWKALVEAVEEGKVRSIGVSNYGVHHLDELEGHIRELEAERGPGRGGVLSVGQWEVHPWVARRDVVEWCARRGVVVEAYSPLVRGERWGERGLKTLAEKYGVSEAQVLVRWSLQRGLVPLPKSGDEGRIRENADVFGFELTDEEVEGLETDEYAPVCWDPASSGLDN